MGRSPLERSNEDRLSSCPTIIRYMDGLPRPSDDLFNLKEAETLLDKLEALLRDEGIVVAPGSVFEAECLSIVPQKEFASSFPKRRPDREHFAEMRAFNSLMHVVVKLIRQLESKNIKPFLPHLQLLAEGQLGQGVSIPPTKLVERSKTASNKLFELYVGLSCAERFTNVRLESPKKATGQPDVLADFQGKTWAFECKAIKSPRGDAMWKNLDKAVDQIEKSRADTGAVVFNLSSLVKHQEFLPDPTEDNPNLGCFGSNEHLDATLLSTCNKLLQPILDTYSYDEIDGLFEGKKAIKGVVGYIETTALKAYPFGTLANGCGASAHRCFSRTNVVPSIAAMDALQASLTGR